MWQILWMINLLPDWVFHMLLIAGTLGVIASYILKKIPFVNTYNAPLRIISITVIILTVWIEGGRDVQHAWEAKVAEMESKVAAAEVKSQEINVVVKEKIVKKLELVRTRGDDIIKYVDREVVTDKEVIKFIESCPIPDKVIKAHNAAALNKSIEEIK